MMISKFKSRDAASILRSYIIRNLTYVADIGNSSSISLAKGKIYFFTFFRISSRENFSSLQLRKMRDCCVTVSLFRVESDCVNRRRMGT